MIDTLLLQMLRATTALNVAAFAFSNSDINDDTELAAMKSVAKEINAIIKRFEKI